jgi:diguanylate cyclase (GGDEF)-like protein/PAS domain S-box-containing protein
LYTLRVARHSITAELFKVAVGLGRTSWSVTLAFGLVAVLLLAREGRIFSVTLWWIALALVALVRVWYGQTSLRALSNRPRVLPARADAYAAIAAAEGTVWALLLVLLPASGEFAVRFQLTLTVLVLLCGMLPYAPAGLPWLAFAIPLGFAQLVHLMTRESQHQELMLLAWGVTMGGAALSAQWLKRALGSNLSKRNRANQSARVHEHANVELNRSREQLRLALDTIDAGIADTNLITNERFVSSRYSKILGYADRDTCLREHRLSDALHPDERERVIAARKRHVEGGAPLREECRLRRFDGSYVWVTLRGESVRGTDGRATRLVVSIVDTTERRIADQRLADSERRYRALVEASPSLIWVCDRHGRLNFVSDRACRQVYGYEPREMIGRFVWDFNAAGFTRREFLRRFAPALHGHPVFDMEAVLCARNKEPVYVNVSALPILNEAGAIEAVTGICSDITAVKQRERELNVAMRNQQAIYDAAGEGIVFVRNGRIEAPNRALARMIGVTREALVGQRIEEILAEQTDWETIAHATSASAVRGEAAIHEVMLRANDGHSVWCQLTSRQAGDGGAVILVLTDITALKRREELAWHQANHDELTGLPNRRLLGEHARRLLSVAMRQRRLASVLVLDLDGFKDINDLFGHSYGDGLLKRVAVRLSGVLRDYDVVARTGGDEFVVLLPEIEEPSIAVVVAEKLIAAASENIENSGRTMRLHASVGIALFPRDGQDFETLLGLADAAMYAAKAAGKNCYQFAAELPETRAAPGAASRTALSTEMTAVGIVRSD